MEIKHAIQVTIVDDSQGVKCDALCGVDWSSTEAVALATERIKDRFGDKVQLKYLDLAKSVTNHRALELSQQVRDKDLSLPLLVIDGQPRISGQFDIRQLMNAIEVEVEIRS
jgi:disulfide oxidoreductase YuzD